MVRVFTAIDVPYALKSRIVKEMQALRSVIGVRPVDDTALHITLHFFENLSYNQIEEVKAAMGMLRKPRFTISLRGVGFFDSKRPKVVFIRVAEGADRIREIYYELRDLVKDPGIEWERRDFVPHLTVARVNGYSDSLDGELEDFAVSHTNELGSFVCDRIVLKRSDSTKEGVVHTELQGCDLR